MARGFMREIILRYGRIHNFLINPFSKSQRNHCCYSSESASDFPYFSSKAASVKLIQTCRSSSRFYQIQGRFTTSGFLRNPSMGGRVLKLSLNFCEIDYTLLIFKCIHFPDTFCVNTVIKGYAFASLPNKVVGFYFEMLQEDGVLFKPNSFTFPPLISSCTRSRDSVSGRKCHGQAVKVGVDRALHVENALIHMYASCGFLDVAWKVFDEMPVRDLVSWNSMLDGYGKAGDMGNAHKVFDKMTQRNVVSWNAMMKGYLDVRNPGVVLKLFRKMVRKGDGGNDTTIVSVIAACGRSCRLKEGRSVHAVVIRTLTAVSLIIGTALIDMYSRCGRPDIARIVFDRMSIKNLVCWNAMISGESVHGNPENGLRSFDQMLKLGNVVPDEATYVGVLCACARGGLLPEGKTRFLEMTEVFKLKPNFAHFWCMANLYASHGLVQNAVEILKNMPVDINTSPESPLWAGLLGTCRFKGDVGTGEKIAKALIEDDPLNSSYHELLIAIYAVAGRWEDVATIKGTMKERGFSVPGVSLVELTELVNNLEVGDKWRDSIYTLCEHP